MNLWEKAALFGHANKPGKLGFNAHRIPTTPRTTFPVQNVDGSPLLTPEQGFLAWARANGCILRQDFVPAAPKARRTAAQSASVPLQVSSARLEQQTEAFARYGRGGPLAQAFTLRGELRKGWGLARGVPTWLGV